MRTTKDFLAACSLSAYLECSGFSLCDLWPWDSEASQQAGPMFALQISCTHSAPIAGSLPCSTSPGWCLTGIHPRKVGAQVTLPDPLTLGTLPPAQAEVPHRGYCPFLS